MLKDEIKKIWIKEKENSSQLGYLAKHAIWVMRLR